MASATNLTSEEAANAFARFANVTHMDPNNFTNPGSSVVALGNNFAVSEKEIAEYTQRLALMGHMMGMKESDVVAFGATIASMDMESASTSTALIRFTNQVTGSVSKFTGTSSKDLEMFTHITEMTEEPLLPDTLTRAGKKRSRGTFATIRRLQKASWTLWSKVLPEAKAIRKWQRTCGTPWEWSMTAPSALPVRK